MLIIDAKITLVHGQISIVDGEIGEIRICVGSIPLFRVKSHQFLLAKIPPVPPGAYR